MPIEVKICGLTSERAVEAAIEAGANALGFVLAPSVRQVTLERAEALMARVPSGVLKVVVFGSSVDTEWLEQVKDGGADVLQAEARARPPRSPLPFLPVFRDGPGLARSLARHRGARPSERVLVEGRRSGQGVRARWPRVAEAARGCRLVLSGGLDADCVGEAIRQVRPVGVDVSSGVESLPGVKDAGKIAAFVRAVRTAEELR